MAIFPEYFKAAVLSKDLAKVKRSTKKLLKDIDKFVDKVANYKNFEKGDKELIHELKKVYRDCKSKKEQKLVLNLLYLANNMVLNIELLRRRTNFNVPNKKIIKRIYEDLQDLLDKELSFEKLMTQKAKYAKKHPGLSLAHFDPETRVVKLSRKIPPKYRKYIKIHEIVDHRAFSIPRIIRRYRALYIVFKKFAPANQIYMKSGDEYEATHYLEAHIVGVYEEFRAAKKEGVLDNYFNWLIDAYRNDISSRGRLVKNIWRVVYKLVR